MAILLSLLIGTLCGFIAGVLVVRNNLGRAKQLNDKAVDVLSTLKK
jgi:F0F1-type ATP synthase assembly protein I